MSREDPGQPTALLIISGTRPGLPVPLPQDRPASLAERSSHCFPTLRKTNCQVTPVIAARLIPHWIKARSRPSVNAMQSILIDGSGERGVEMPLARGRLERLDEVGLLDLLPGRVTPPLGEQIAVARVVEQVEPVAGPGPDESVTDQPP